jgi:hydroxymethylglutaryl-CoA reductase (NADPH)
MEMKADAGGDKIPRSPINDYTREQAAERRRFAERKSGATLDHVGSYSFDPALLPGNIENFFGVAQVPIGLAGPLRIEGEHARGDFYVPLATTEGTLVASYNRGMRLLGECGGVKTTVVERAMQRSPAFIMEDALAARALGHWIDDHIEEIRQQAEATTRHGKLTDIEQYAVGPMRHLRFNYTTGGADKFAEICAAVVLAGETSLASAVLAGDWVRSHDELGRNRK